MTFAVNALPSTGRLAAPPLAIIAEPTTTLVITTMQQKARIGILIFLTPSSHTLTGSTTSENKMARAPFANLLDAGQEAVH
jgi:hypothetical protein